ncbi:MAG: c-type cytochrome [Caulobacteraceae bacterium]
MAVTGGFAPLAAALLAACSPTSGGVSGASPNAPMPGRSALAAIPLGQPPGQPVSPAANVANPFEGDAQAIAQGKTLFSAMNCVYCHGTGGSGLIGPPLNSTGWRYGGAPAQLYNSIHDGRPQGMPAWGSVLPPDQIWRLVAYIESLGGASPPATSRMAALGGEQPSTTGPQVAGQDQTDSAHAALVAGDKARGDR